MASRRRRTGAPTTAGRQAFYQTNVRPMSGLPPSTDKRVRREKPLRWVRSRRQHDVCSKSAFPLRADIPRAPTSAWGQKRTLVRGLLGTTFLFLLQSLRCFLGGDGRRSASRARLTLLLYLAAVWLLTRYGGKLRTVQGEAFYESSRVLRSNSRGRLGLRLRRVLARRLAGDASSCSRRRGTDRGTAARGLRALGEGLRLPDQISARVRGRAVEHAGDCNLFAPPRRHQ